MSSLYNSPEKEQKQPNIEKESPLWRIKYRPHSLEEIQTLYPEIHSQFKGYVKDNNFPHLMIVGPTGSGKTTLAEILAREILREEFSINFKLLFANDRISSEERRENERLGRISTKRIGSAAGMQRRYRPFIQIRVKPFVTNKKFGKSPFKILVIKNFHMLDVEQQAFRRIMEQYSRNARMILITDRISAIIDPIISRCQLVMVPYLSEPKYNKLLHDICENEGITIKRQALRFIRRVTGGNIGDSLDLLQLTYIKNKKKEITIDDLTEMHKEIKSNVIKQLFIATTSGDPKTVRKALRTVFWKLNLSKNEILLYLSRVIETLPLERSVRALLFTLIADADFASLDSTDDEIQLQTLLSKMTAIGKLL